jgi:TolB protein
MLLRAYRISDKLGLLVQKLFVAVLDQLLAGASVVTGATGGVFGLIFGLLLGVLGVVWKIVRWVAVKIGAILRWLLGLLGVVGGAGVRGARRVTGATVQTAGATMARRAARAELDTKVVVDPLQTQNRMLSVLTVVLLAALIGVVLWATNPGNQSPQLAATNLLGGNTLLQADDGQPQATQVALATAVPTVTPLPSLLEARGSIAYTVRENGQDDIWVMGVGDRVPLRLTNSPEDERDAAWSPDGRRLAYASRQDGNWDIYVYDMQTGETTRMTYDLSFQGAPRWSPDGEWLVYESYQGNNLDIYVMRRDGSSEQRLTEHPEPDFSPAWSPDGRRVAFVSWRDGNQDIYLFSLDDPRDAAVVNLTNTPQRHEDYPAWSPDGSLIAYSAVDGGVEKVFVKSADDPDAVAQVLGRGRAPTWSPDGSSLIVAVDSIDGTQLVAIPFAGTGVATLVVPVPAGTTRPDWTTAALPPALIQSGGVGPGVIEALYIEQESAGLDDPPYKLQPLLNVNTQIAALNERVNDSFNALRERVLAEVGRDFLGELEDAFWSIDRLPQPGEARRNWHMTGRAFSINRNAIAGFPPPIEIVREDGEINTQWRVYVRVADGAQNGQLGEPLRRMPWDFMSRNQGDVEAYNQGGRLRASMPSGYYVDLTALAADYGWEPIPAGTDWRANYNSINFWMFVKPDGLSWYDAMRELYTEPQMGGFAPAPTQQAPLQAPTAFVPEVTPGPIPSATASPVPPEEALDPDHATLPPPPEAETSGE